ncbi:MAG: hypothetical protein ACOC0Y_00120 [Spirochaetota bacterium]
MSTIRPRLGDILARFLVVAGWGCAAALSGCGIPQLVFLAPPDLDSRVGPPADVEVEHDAVNGIDSFLGYELFYKFYNPDTNQGRDGNTFSADRTAISNAAPSAVASTLASREYHRVYGRTESGSPTFTSRPVLAVPLAQRGSQFQIDIAFPASAGDGPAIADWGGVTLDSVSLYRHEQFWPSSDAPIGFDQNEINPNTQGDLPDPADTPQYLLGLVAVSYGINYVTGDFAEVYSSAEVIVQPIVIPY